MPRGAQLVATMTVGIPIVGMDKGTLCSNDWPRIPISVDIYVPSNVGVGSSRMEVLNFDETIGARPRNKKEWDEHAYSQCGVEHFSEAYNKFRCEPPFTDCRVGSTWMLVLNELMQLGLDTADLKSSIDDLHDQPWAAKFLHMQDNTADGFIDNPFENEQYKDFYAWMVQKRKDYPDPTANSYGGVRVRFPDLRLASFVCLGAGAIQERLGMSKKMVDPGFDNSGDIGEECMAFLGDLFGEAANVVLPVFGSVGLVGINFYYPLGSDGNADAGTTDSYLFSASPQGTLTNIQQEANEKGTSGFFENSEVKAVAVLPLGIEVPMKARLFPLWRTGGSRARRTEANKGFAVTMNLDDMVQQVGAAWEARPPFVDDMLAFLGKLLAPPTAALFTMSSASASASDLPGKKGPATAKMPAAMSVPAGMSLTFTLATKFFSTIADELFKGPLLSPIRQALKPMLGFLDPLEFTASVSVKAATCGVSLKASSLAPKDDGDCGMVCQLLHTVLDGDMVMYGEADIRFLRDLWLRPYSEARFEVGMDNLELQIPGISWFRLQGIKFESFMTTHHLKKGGHSWITGTFDLPNMGKYSGSYDIEKKQGGAEYKFPDGTMKPKADVDRLMDHRLQFEGGFGFKAEGTVVGMQFKFKQSGYYMNAGFSPYFHFGNLGIEFVPSPEPPWLQAVQLQGGFCVGSFGRCGLCLLEGLESSKCGPGNRLIRMEAYAGISENLPDNYLMTTVNGEVSIGSILEVFDLDTLLEKAGLPKVPDAVGNALKLGPRDGQTGVVLSYAYEEKTIDGIYNPATGVREAVVIPRGLRVDGRLTVFEGIPLLEFYAEIEIVLTDTSLLINYTQSAINFANIFKVRALATDRSPCPHLPCPPPGRSPHDRVCNHDRAVRHVRSA